MIKKRCLNCNKEILTYPCLRYRKKYCSRSCKTIDLNRKKIIGFKDGNKSWRHPNSINNQFKKGHKVGFQKKNIDPQTNRKYSFQEWRKLSKEIKERDNYTCQICGSIGNLNVHHILPWITFPELAFSRDNLITLCIHCHSKFHSKEKMRFGKHQEVSP